ncbi:hypothetical protein GCM10009716_25390 [Streptomyces sodiiphilus]|uniref:Integral membrane protein n=1 Tax=Streptomyces sodiiphilus TaxID=226217 RepID=A0ABP5AKL5_9ACTN
MAITVRLLFASFPLWSLGLLAWVPSLRFAVLRRRPWDWLVFGAVLAMTVLYVVLLVALPDDADNLNALAGAYVLLFLAGTVTHAVVGDLFPRPGDAPPAPHNGHFPYSAPTLPSVTYGHAPAPGHTPATHGYGYPPSAATPASPAAASPAPPPGPAAPAPSPRMRQVASELDELGDLLRKHEGGR